MSVHIEKLCVTVNARTIVNVMPFFGNTPDIWQMLCIYMFLNVLLNILFPQVVQQILVSVEGSSLNPLLFSKLDILVALIQKPSPIWLFSTFDGFETEKHCHSFPLLEYKYVLCGQQSYTSPGKSCCNENNSGDHIFSPCTFFAKGNFTFRPDFIVIEINCMAKMNLIYMPLYRKTAWLAQITHKISFLSRQELFIHLYVEAPSYS